MGILGEFSPPPHRSHRIRERLTFSNCFFFFFHFPFLVYREQDWNVNTHFIVLLEA